MADLPEADNDKLYYSISEVAVIFNVAPSLIRFWEKEFDQFKPRKNNKGVRFYTRADLETMQLIYHLVKERGYTLQGAKEKLKASRKLPKSELEVIESLKRLRCFLVDIKQQLDQSDPV